MIDIGGHILNVNNQGVDYREQSLEVGRRHAERSFQVELPCGATQFAELTDKLRAQTSLAASEGYTTVCGDEIKLVDARIGIQFLR